MGCKYCWEVGKSKAQRASIRCRTRSAPGVLTHGVNNAFSMARCSGDEIVHDIRQQLVLEQNLSRAGFFKRKCLSHNQRCVRGVVSKQSVL